MRQGTKKQTKQRTAGARMPQNRLETTWLTPGYQLSDKKHPKIGRS